ncbi:hypothetical protein [Brevundimonas sp. A19_0]|uniref:hypothetical protein n=1 Tax=Brevundimonas sp. A19_0 TaxID=2821087 RepID=UPI001ADC24DA|nr:hypothetical protein [Brevundimonas sp. A19_0]MBO9502910.1 hypothetical protein [Brevundimonas sp. A19_0]
MTDEIVPPSAGGPRRVWLKAFWGFNPGEDGYLGFTRESDRGRLIDEWRPGDLILIYGAASPNTKDQDRRQALGFLEIDPVPTTDADRSSAAGMARKRDMGWLDRWKHAVPVRRAWKVTRRIEVKHLAPDTYTHSRARNIASRGELLADHEAEAALCLPVVPVNVFGEPPLTDVESAETTMTAAFSPSRGFTPSHGERRSNYEDGDAFLYMLTYQGCVATLLGRDKGAVGQRIVAKIGYSNDPARRIEEVNSGFPPAAKCRWKAGFQSKAFPSAEAAKAAEDGLKGDLKSRAESLGGEFFLGDETVLNSAFFAAAAPAAFRVIATTKSTRR